VGAADLDLAVITGTSSAKDRWEAER
jgi:hypothetical protein